MIILALAYHYAQLQSLAFEEDFDPASAEAEQLDKTLPKHAGMHKAAGEYMREWNKEIEDDNRAALSLAKPGKRSAAVDVGYDASSGLPPDMRGVISL